LSATSTLLSGRRDVIVVSSVSCLYGIGNPNDFHATSISLEVGDTLPIKHLLYRLVEALYTRTERELTPATFRVNGETIDIMTAIGNNCYRIIFFDNEIEAIQTIDPVSGHRIESVDKALIFPANLFVTTKERIAEELHKIMLSRKPSTGWIMLDKTGLLPYVLPELVALKGVEVKQGKGHKDVFFHTLQVVDNLAAQLAKLSISSDKLWLLWAALLHDIGKPKSKAWAPQTGWTFRNHNYIGAKMIPQIFKKMKLPLNEKMEYVRNMVDLHMRPINLIEETVTDSAVRRLLFEAGDDIDDLMLLCDADITSRNEEKVARYHSNYQLVRQKMVELEERDRIRNFQPPVKGDEIMQILHLEPCSLVGELKAAIKDAILDGIIPNEYEAAKDYLMQLAKEKGLC
jgi:putative nucleotidyltransferase with HDIG domain